MKKYLIAAGVTSLLIAAQAMASDAAGLIGAPETAVAPVTAAETAAAPAAVARAVSNAPARPLMVAGEAGALSASSVAVPVVAEVTVPGMIGAASRVTDRLAPSYNASLNLSTTPQATCQRNKLKGTQIKQGQTQDVESSLDDCADGERESRTKFQNGLVAAGIGITFVAVLTVAASNDEPASS